MKAKGLYKGLYLAIALAVLFSLAFAIMPTQTVRAEASTVYVTVLEPSWTAASGGGVFSAYVGPPAYGYVSPGTTELYDGRQAGIIKAGLAPDPGDGVYWDEGLFGFKPTVTIDVLAAGTLAYDVENQYGENPVWMTIEIDTGVADNRADNTSYQFVPTTNPAGWHTVDAAAGQWQKWNDDMGNVTGNPLISLSAVVTAHTGLNVVRAYLRLGMGNSYHGTAGLGTVAWVDKATIGAVTYDFVVASSPVTVTGGYVAAVMTVTSPTVPGFGQFKSGENKVASFPDGTVTVVNNSQDPKGWTVTAKDVSNGGYMRLGDGTWLANPLYISSNNSSWPTADVGCTWNGATFPGSLPMWLSQTVTSSDNAGSYSITLVFSYSLTF
jgi:hypothetical protein